MYPAPIGKLRAVFREADRLSVPVCVHLGDDLTCIDTLNQEFKVDIIIAHLGTCVYRLEIDRSKAIELAKHANVYLETSGNTYPFVDYAVRALGPSKIILGSDFPHENPMVSAKTVQLLKLPAREKELILNLNIKIILRIK